MSNDWFNIRFGDKHWQWERGRWPKWKHNSYWEDGQWKTKKAGWLKIYTFFGFHFGAGVI